jgi:hypothetical protein
MKFRYKLGLFVTICIYVFFLGRGCAKPKPPIRALPSGETERIIVDPGSHTITIQTPSGLKTETLPDRPSIFDVQSNGTVKLTVKQFGLEHHVFAGAVLSDSARLGVGIDGIYYKKLDLGVGVADQIGAYTPIVFAKLTYNVKGNIQTGIVYQNNQYIGGIVSVRLF